MTQLFKIRSAFTLAALLTLSTAHSVSTVGVYGTNSAVMPITDAVSNSAVNGISLTNFQTLIGTAFTANAGGVVDFEAATGWTAPAGTPISTVDVAYGAGQGGTLTYTRTDAGNMFNANNNNGTNVASGTQYLGMNAVNGTFTFSKGLSAFGLTMLSRGVQRHATLTFTLDNSTTISTSTEMTNAAGGIFFGMAAPTGRTITGMSFSEPDGFTRYDDLAFVVAAPVPEPTSLATLALGGWVLLRRRKK